MNQTASLQASQPNSASDDPRPLVRIFLASSQDLREEREHFEAMIGRIAQNPAITRQYRLAPTHWQQGGGDTEGRTVQEQIMKSLEFDEVAIVLMLIGSYVGPGTREEYETAKRLRIEHDKWPKILAFFKCHTDGVTLIGNESVKAFHRQVIEDNIGVPINYADEDQLKQRLEKQLADLLLPKVRRDRTSGERLRRLFFVWAAIGVVLSVALLIVSRMMGFPDDNVSQGKVLFILFGPPLLFIQFLVISWLLWRLVKEFDFAWNSVEYADERIYAVFRNLFPRSVMPRHLRESFPVDPLGDVLAWGLLLLVLGLPLAAHYNCVFDELLEWEFVVEPHMLAEPPAPKDSTEANPVRSLYVEHKLKWPYTLREIPEFDRNGKRLAGPVYVYSPRGNLGVEKKFGKVDAHRMNMGPEVVPPYQPMGYVAMFAIQALLTPLLLLRIALVGRRVKVKALDPRRAALPLLSAPKTS